MLTLHRKRRAALGLAVTVLFIYQLVAAWGTNTALALTPAPTGASFSLAVAQFANHRQARLVAANIEASGLPAFTRSLRNGAVRQVIVGPYVSIDEAEDAQHDLRRRGFGRTRMLVDESVRRIAAEPVATGYQAASVSDLGFVVVAAAGRVSAVLEMPSEPRQVVMLRLAGNVLEVDAGPTNVAILASRTYAAPAGINLFEGISIGDAAASNGHVVRTRLTTPALVQSRVRTVGRRVYIDLWSPQSIDDTPVQRRRDAPVAIDDEADEEDLPAVTPVEEYQEALRPIVSRFEEIEPFLIAAVSSPSPEVMSALARTLDGLEEWARTIEPPVAGQARHDDLARAISQASESLGAAFEGDRVAHARQAIALFQVSHKELLP